MRDRGGDRRPGRWRKGLLVLFLLSAAVGSVFGTDALLNASVSLNELEGSLEDGLWLRLPRIEPNDRIVLVTVQPSTERVVTSPVTSVGLPRSAYAKLFRALDQAGASVVAADVDFHDQSGPGNPELQRALASLQTCRVVLGSVKTAKEPVENPDAFGGYDLEFETLDGLLSDRVVRGSVVNYAPQDQVIGCVPYRIDAGTGEPILHLAALTASLGLNGGTKPAVVTEDWSRLRIGSLDWELGGNQEVLTRWTKDVHAFREYSFEDALRIASAPRSKSFQDKIVIVGDARPGMDNVRTPVFDFHSGVYFIAQMVNTLLLPPTTTSPWWPKEAQMSLAALFATIAAFSVFSGRRWLVVLGPLVVVGLALWVPVVAIERTSLRMEVLMLVGPALLTSVVCYATLAAKVGPLDLRAPGEVRIGTVLFVDLRGSTEMTRELGGRGYQQMFGEFMRHVAPDITACGGQIERTLGDGFVALFASKASTNTAVACREAVGRVFRHAEEVSRNHGQPFRIKAGFEHGPVTGGFVPERGTKSWSTAGNTVNLAARLLDACGQFGVDVAVGPVAAAMLAEEAPVQEVGSFLPKGFEAESKVFTFAVSPLAAQDAEA